MSFWRFLSLPVANMSIIPQEYRLYFFPVSSVTSSVNKAAFAAFFVVVEANWNRNHSTGEEKFHKSRGVLKTHAHMFRRQLDQLLPHLTVNKKCQGTVS